MTTTVVSSGIPPLQRMSFSLANIAKGESFLVSTEASRARSTRRRDKSLTGCTPAGCAKHSSWTVKNNEYQSRRAQRNFATYSTYI